MQTPGLQGGGAGFYMDGYGENRPVACADISENGDEYACDLGNTKTLAVKNTNNCFDIYTDNDWQSLEFCLIKS